jgi:outer membrane protein W
MFKVPSHRGSKLVCMATHVRRIRSISTGLIALVVMASPSAAQQAGRPWTFRTSVLLTGNSDTSPEGYKAMSGFGLGVAVRRQITGILSAELTLATVSREVVIEEPSGVESSQGSIESIPMNLLVQVRPSLNGGVHPYAGLGLNFTPVWEKTGALDSDDIAPTFGIAAQLGVDIDLSPGVLVNVDLLWNTAEPDIEADGVRVTTLTMNTFTLSAGVGFRF